MANEGNATIEKYDSQGNGSLFATLPANSACYGVVLDVSNTLYVINAGNSILKVTNPGGVVSTFYSGNTDLDEPYGAVFDNAGNLFVANGLGGWIEKFDQQTNGTRFATPGHGPIGVTFDSAGNLYASLSGPDQILKYDTLGNPSTFVPSLGHTPWGMAFDSSGNLYVAGESDSSIEKVSPQGTVTVFANSSSGLFATAFLAILNTTGVSPIIGGATSADSADFTLNTTGVSPIIGGATSADSANFTLNTTGISPILGGATSADSADFTLNTTGVSPIIGGATSADSANFTLNTTGVSPIVGGASLADSANFILNLTGFPPTPAMLIAPVFTPGHIFQFTLTGQSGSQYVVQGTTGLSPAIWVNLVTNVAPFIFVDTSASTVTQHFYRVMFLP